MTEGEYRVGVSFNPSGSDAVDDFKRRTAALIDEMQNFLLATPIPGAARCAVEAMTNYENACMWAVKAITKQQRE